MTVKKPKQTRKRRLGDTTSLHIQLPRDHYLLLDALAAADRTSISHHIRRAVADYLERTRVAVKEVVT
jgi:predicted transcriptional regulator